MIHDSFITNALSIYEFQQGDLSWLALAYSNIIMIMTGKIRLFQPISFIIKTEAIVMIFACLIKRNRFAFCASVSLVMADGLHAE
jgi:hypothetical protein